VQNNPINFVDPDGLRGDLPIFLPIPSREEYGRGFPQWMPEELIDILYEIDSDPTIGVGPPIGGGVKTIGVCVRSAAARSNFLKDLAASGKVAKWMKQWLERGKVPPGYQVDHIKPLSVSGADISSNMRLKLIEDHIIRHRYYRPWVQR
jgi:hypothetical protein